MIEDTKQSGNQKRKKTKLETKRNQVNDENKFLRQIVIHT